MTKIADNKEDIKLCPTEEGQMGLRPPEDMAGFSGRKHAQNKPDDYSEVMKLNEEILLKTLEDKSDQDVDENHEDSDFNIKEETDKKGDADGDSDSEQSDNIFEEITNQEKHESQYKSVFSKNYRTFTIKEEPINDVKSMFKESSLDFEKQKYHQKIFRKILEDSNKINLKDLQEEYLTRLREVANIEVFVCSLCDFQTMKLANLTCHLLTIHNGKLERETFKCINCDYTCSFRSYMIRHLIKHKKRARKRYSKHQTEQFEQCDNDYFDSDLDSDEDTPLHTKPAKRKVKKEKYPCADCNYNGRSEEGLRRHRFMHKDRTKCDLCSFESNNKNVLKKHKDTHIIDKYYQCYKCNYRNGNKTTLGRHLLNEHKVVNEASKRSKICEICSFACSNSNALKIHYTSHKTVNELHEEEIFKCPEPGCNHQTKLKNHLMVHMKVHEAPKFVCETCGLASRRKQTYEDHISTHKKASEIEWLQCPTCPYKARIRAHLRAHIRKGIHGEPHKRHIRLKYREGEDAIPKRKPKQVKENPASDKSEKRPKRKAKPNPKNNVGLDEAIVNFGELASAFFRNEAANVIH